MEIQMSHSPEAEASLLGSVMVSERSLTAAMDVLTPDDFYSTPNREIFAAILALYSQNSKIGLITLSEALARAGKLDAIGGDAYLGYLMCEVSTTDNAEQLIAVLQEKTLKRRLTEAGASILADAQSPETTGRESLENAEGQIFGIAQAGKHDTRPLVPVAEVLREAYDEIDRSARGEVVGVKTGFSKLDEQLGGGLHCGEAIYLAARPSMGKTSLALCIALNAAAEKNRVAIFSMESRRIELCQKMMCIGAGISMTDIRRGKLTVNDYAKLSGFSGELAVWDISITDSPALDVAKIRSKLRRNGGADLVIIDYLQLMPGDESRGQNRNQQIEKISRGLKFLANEFNCPLLVLSQLSRALAQRSDKRPQLTDLRESGAIEQDADVVIFIHREPYYNEEHEPREEAEIIIGKQRNGPVGTIKSIEFIDWRTTFRDKEIYA